MNVIKDSVLRHISENNVIFVFSTEIVASLWAKKSLLFGKVNSISLNRFIAWDTFKRRVLISKDAGGQKTEKKSVSAVIRTLFVQSLLSNCATHSPFPALVPDSFACDAELFVSWFTRILPELQSLQKRYRNNQHIVPCAELQDLLLLEDIYRRFLNEHDLFEPSWECVDMIESEKQYYIFFPQLFDDFGEYEAILASCQSVHILYAQAALEKVSPPILKKYAVAREELRATAHEIRRLYDEEGVAFEEIAITVPHLERIEPYIRRELSLYAIPVQYRSGKALASYSAGKLFHLIQDCVTQHFSFQSLKALLLNPQLPWKNPERAEQLIEFGIENNCVCAYMKDGVSHDVWEETFQRKTGEHSEELLRRFYAALKKTMTDLCASHSFSELRRRYFAFRYESLFFDETAFTDEANDVLGRCLDELAELISIEERYPDLIPKQVFSFYVSLLRERMYVKQSDTFGVSIFPYRVAAGAPFQHHFIIDASQDSLTVLYRPFDFLRSDIREALSAEDINMSEFFLTVYALATGWDSDEGQGSVERLHVSCATKNMLGYTTPHGYFLRHTIDSTVLHNDAFDDERRFFASGGTKCHAALTRFFDTQKKSFTSWQASASNRTILLTDEIAETNALRDIVLKKQYCDDEVRVSATDLNLFFECRRKWLYRKILRIREISLEAQLVDDTFFGLIYHAILKDFFEYVKEIDHVFVNTHMALYRDTIYELSNKIIRRSNTFADPVAQLLLHGQIETIAEDVASLLDVERIYFDGYAVQDLEKKIVIHENGMYIEGILDRVSVTKDDEAVLLDYKMNNMPKKAECIQHSDELGQVRLVHFQIALYAYLYEKVTGEKIRQAAFISILKKDIQPIIGVMKPKRAACTPETFEQTISVLSEYMNVFKKHIQELDFSIPEDRAFERCVVCDYKTICRTVFTVDGVSANYKIKKGDEECV